MLWQYLTLCVSGNDVNFLEFRPACGVFFLARDPTIEAAKKGIDQLRNHRGIRLVDTWRHIRLLLHYENS